jgi:DNA-binding NtrC family response regulator
LRDLGSANGTYVNGVRISSSPLAAGDLFRIGISEFVVEGPPDPGRSTVLASQIPDQAEQPSAGQLSSAYHELRRLKRLTAVGPELVGDAPSFLAAVALARRAAPAPSTVLVSGPTGSGKELIARLLHAESPWASGPFVAVNCAAIPEGLQESDLFGHEKGAFTGAVHAREGSFELADGGSLFLDELGELSAAVQAKLLRVLETRSFHRVGASQPTRVNVRVIAATHRDLPAEVASGRFREDLYHRLDVVRIRLPSLAERPGDVSILARHLLKRKAAELALPARELSAEALDALERYGWPGNVRELANVLERALVLARGAGIGLEDLPPEIVRPRVAQPGVPRTLEEIERQAVLDAMEATGWNKRAAAERLGISWPTLHKKVLDYGLRPLESPQQGS